jgi:hypothetical protein
MGIVVLAAWPGIVRPAFLDRPHELSASALRLFGISAGQPLFQTDVSPWKQHGYCLFVREQSRLASGDAPAAPEVQAGGMFFPPDGECLIEGLHLRLPPVNRATHRMLSSAWGLGPGGGKQEQQSDAFLASIGRAFCRRSEQPPSSVEAVWIWYYRNYDNATVMRRNGLYFDYSCETEQLGEVSWHPDDDAVLARWGAAPW